MKLLFLDIETSPNKVYVWGLWNQDVSINQIVEPGSTLCWAAKWQGKRKMLFDAIWAGGETTMLSRIHTLIDEADAVVHYNGTRFDMPTLNQEFLKHEMRPPAPYKQIDLLLVARKQFRLPSNKLDYVAQHLGVGGKLPHKGMALWRGCMEGAPASWRTMERYNKRDVLLLERVYERFLPWITAHPNQALYGTFTRPVCTNCGSTEVLAREVIHTKVLTYKRFQCKVCGTWLKARTTCSTKEQRAVTLTQAV